MTELNSELKREVLEATQLTELPEFGTREYLAMFNGLVSNHPDLAERLATAMREDEPVEIPAGLRRHLSRAKRRDSVNDLKRKTTQKQSPDGRWVPNKNFTLALIALACLGGVFMVMSAQNSQTKKQQSSNLLGTAVGLAGKGGATSSDSSLPTPEITANSSDPSSAATIPVSNGKAGLVNPADPQAKTVPDKASGSQTSTDINQKTPRTTSPLPNQNGTNTDTGTKSSIKDMSSPGYGANSASTPGQMTTGSNQNQNLSYAQTGSPKTSLTGYKNTQKPQKQSQSRGISKSYPRSNRVPYSAVKSSSTPGRITSVATKPITTAGPQASNQNTTSDGSATTPSTPVTNTGVTRASTTVTSTGAAPTSNTVNTNAVTRSSGIAQTGTSRPSSVNPTGLNRTSSVTPSGSTRATTSVTGTGSTRPQNTVTPSVSNRPSSVTATAPGNRPSSAPMQTNATPPTGAVNATANMRSTNTVNTTSRVPTTVVFRPDSSPSNSNTVTSIRPGGSSNPQNIATTSNTAAQNPNAGFNTVYRREGAGSAATPNTPTPAPQATSSQTQNPEPSPPASTSQAASNSLPANLKPGARIKAKLVTTIYTAETAVAPVVIESDEGLWLGRATLGASKRVEVFLERLIDKDGNEHAVQGLGFDVNLVQGLACNVELVAPTLAVDLLQSGLTGLSTYLGGQLGAGTTTTTPGGSTSQSRAAPSLLDSVLGTVGGLFKLPEGNQTIVRVAKVEKDTALMILYGIGAQPSTQPPTPR